MFILGLVIAGSIGVFATIEASNITYNGTTVDLALNDLYTKANSKDIKLMLEQLTNGFGGSGVEYSGFTVGHKYMALYTSNFWEYGNNEYNARIESGASNINIISSAQTTSPRASYYYAFASVITFTAQDTSIRLSYGSNNGSNAGEYAMYFLDITNSN